MARVIVHLLQDEFDALLAVAQAERRSPSDQLGFWARQHLEAAGLLAPAGKAGNAPRPGASLATRQITSQTEVLP